MSVNKIKQYHDEYWHIDPNGRPDYRGNPARKKISEDDLPDGASVVIMDMVEDMNDQAAVDAHWTEFHSHIAAGKYVKLVKGGQAGIKKAKAKRSKKNSGSSGWNAANQPLTLLLLEQFIKPEFWDWTNAEKQTLGSLPEMMAVIRARLESAGLEPKVLYGILHDKDDHDVWDQKFEVYVRQPKGLHIHVVGKLGKGATLAKLAEIIGVPIQQLEKPDSGRWTFDNKCAYLIHAKEHSKYLYDPREVHTELGEGYMQLYSRQKVSWEKGRAKKIHNAARDDAEWLVDMILDGRVTKTNINLTDELFRIYSRNKRRCDEAFDTYAERHMALEVQALENGEFSCCTIFIEGDPGSGKSIFADAFARWLCRVYGWQYARATAEHSTEKWNGEEVLLLDDVHVGTMNVTAWLQLLDPYHANPLDERYRGKDACKPRVMIITSTLEPVEYFYYVRNQSAASRNEALDQFFRRLLGVLSVGRYDIDSPYNCAWSQPVRVPEYSRKISKFDKMHGCHEALVTGLTIDFRPNNRTLIQGESPAYSYWGIAEVLAREIDARNSNTIASRVDASSVFSSVAFAMQARFAVSPMPFPDDYLTRPAAIPASQTKNALAIAAAEAAKAQREQAEAAAKALAEAREASHQNSIISDGEFAGKTVRQAEWIKSERERLAKQAQAELKKLEEQKAQHEKRLAHFRRACVTFVAINTESFMRSHFDSLLTDEYWLAAALRGHLDKCYSLNGLSDDEIADVFIGVYKSRLPCDNE